MPFQKPLKVFVSYSHEDVELFRHFVKHLKSLEDDGIIRQWHDGMLRAGEKWDTTIREEVKTCDVFLALTSAAFNNSGYIQGVELETALRRHESGECLLIAVHMRSWRPPQFLSALQFVTNPKYPVATAPDLDTALLQVVVEVERAIEDALKGQGRPQAPARAAASTGPAPPRHLPYLCNWTQPILDLREAFGSARGPQRLPCVAVTLATNEDCAEAFVSRILRKEVPKAMRFEDLPVHRPSPVEWPSQRRQTTCNFDGRVHLSLDAEAGKPTSKKLPDGLTVLHTSIQGENWDGDTEALFAEYLRYWRKWSPLPAGRGLMAVVSVIYSNRAAKDKSAIERLMNAERHEGVRMAVADLPLIPQNHAADWALIKEVREYYRSDCVDDLTRDIRNLYAQCGPIPMKQLADKLLEAVGRYR